MSYDKTQWKNKQAPPINDVNLNKIEAALDSALTSITAHIQDGQNPHGVSKEQIGADSAQTALDRIATGEDRVQTDLDVDATNANVVLTNADAAATAADRVQTGLDVTATSNNVIATNADVVATGADRVAVAADRLEVEDAKAGIDVIFHQVTEDRVVTLAAKELAEKWANEDEDVEVVLGEYSAKHHALKSAASAASASASADLAVVNKISWQGDWVEQTYQQSDAVGREGSSWIANKQTTEVPSLSALDWDLLAQKAVIEGGVQWVDVANTPTTIVGYGLTDAAYSGDNADITSLTGLTGEIRTASKVSFSTGGGETALSGQLTWNADDGTLDLGMNGGAVVQQIGLETLVHVRATSNIANGQVVMLTGALGASGRLLGAPATGILPETSEKVLGVATEDITAGEWGFVTIFGQVKGIDTSAWLEGDALFLDNTVAGGLTKVQPTSPAAKVCVATVVNVHATQGSVHVKISFVQGLGTLTDTEFTGIADDDITFYNAATSLWENTQVKTVNSASLLGTGNVAVQDVLVSGTNIKTVSGNSLLGGSNIETELETGFSNPPNAVVLYDPANRTIALSGTSILYHNGNTILDVADGHVSAAHPDTYGPWFYYYDGSAFVWSASPWVFGQDAMVAYVNYGATDKFAIRECHGLMDWESHREFHEQIGTYLRSGGDVTVVTGSATTANKQPTISLATLADEDLPTVLPELSVKGSYTHFYLSGAGNVTFTTENTHIAPVSGDGRIQYNQNVSGTWQLTNINANNDFHVVFLIAMPTTPDTGSQAYRYVFFQGQVAYQTLSSAQSATFANLNIGTFALLSPEYIPIAKFILRATNNNNGWSVQTYEKIVSSRSQSLIASAGVTSHTLLDDRDALDQHPISAITDLQVELDTKLEEVDGGVF